MFDTDNTRDLQDPSISEIISRLENVDTFYLLFAGALVFLMQAGFAMLCAGSIRAMNVQNILLKNILDACSGALGFYSIGYALAYGGVVGDTRTTFIGTTNYFFLYNVDNYINWFFQFAFAATAATIVAGTVAERCKLEAYFCYSFFLTAFVYPVVVHAVWDKQGFLSAFNSNPLWGIGMVDFAGSGVVHTTGGCTALVAAIVLGPRVGRFYNEHGQALEEPRTFPPHSVALQVLGTFLLWFGWYGFNPGSTLAITPLGYGDVAALAAVTTTLSAATGCISALLFNFVVVLFLTGEEVFDLTMAMNGGLSGLVAITAGCSTVQPWAAIAIGLVAGLVYFGASKALISLKIDDAVDAIPVHLANGIWGCIAVGFFADPNLVSAVYGANNNAMGGVFYGYGTLLACQICGVLFILGWVTVFMFPFFIMLRYLNMLRLDPIEELVGCDVSHHGGSAYNISGPSPIALQQFEMEKQERRSRHRNHRLSHDGSAASAVSERSSNLNASDVAVRIPVQPSLTVTSEEA
mmetsp:Transcript_2142/g.3146  ORF Transcript_2142/g.3146 Transcript_2142/m.3146 type:complete len:522 (-) Transcript_2142:215-1780(-)|eukprot:CAMPEP_0116038578 /NCGR_PEP_ID=MMETSP0321-20121206/22919_1 /TAXON_ID=163516 /ORGANISM="Leptocylindrus danicus var. danicus, Strain B650" /LENGTH=521 /DNA_ID=CAMNT_0003517373 /DNA_START=316 /DNA_END=1881 /DNA_ORIENTATION=+